MIALGRVTTFATTKIREKLLEDFYPRSRRPYHLSAPRSVTLCLGGVSSLADSLRVRARAPLPGG